jgi:hypothetical protein
MVDNKTHQANRRRRLQAAAQKLGYPSIDKLAQAILQDEIELVKDYEKKLAEAKMEHDLQHIES